MTRYLVTGGAGFIGHHLCRLLSSQGAHIRVLDDLSSGDAGLLPRDVDLIEADICDARALTSAVADLDGIFHLAAISSVEACAFDRTGTQRVNLGGARALLEAAGKIPVVFTSSAAVYGDQATLPVAESAPLLPISPYAEDKCAAERLFEAASAPALALRPFNVFGPGQNPASPYSGVISRFVARALLGEALQINGTGDQTRDFIHVADVATALVAAMDHVTKARPDFEAINLCRGTALSVRDLARMIQNLAASEAAPLHGPARDGDILHSCGDPALARDMLGFTAEVSMEAGLASLLPNG